MQKEIFITLFGKVQGVGFRAFIKKEAETLGLFGYVENMDDGDIEACVQGEEEKLSILLEKIKKGPFFAEVDDINVEWSNPQDSFVNFEIR